jgi:hypothetical protein
MATFAGGRWAELVAKLLPGNSPDQLRLRHAMFAVDRACFVEQHTPEALIYEVCSVRGNDSPENAGHMCAALGALSYNHLCSRPGHTRQTLCRAGMWRSPTGPHRQLASMVLAAQCLCYIPCAQDCPVPIGYGQTISAPHMHATCLELLEPQLRPGARVLDVGSGSGARL